jgi:preprotein translocase subunit SecA
MIEDTLSDALEMYAPENQHPEEWDLSVLINWLKSKFLLKLSEEELKNLSRQELMDELFNRITAAYAEKEKSIGADTMKQITKFVLLQAIDSKWKDHLRNIDDLREGIYLRSYGQRDPLVEYRREGYDMFMDMQDSIREESLEYIFKIQVVEERRRRGVFEGVAQEFIHADAETMGDIRRRAQAPPQQQTPFAPQQQPGFAPMPSVPPTGPSQPIRKTPKVGRNDPCPCGSGRKYKKCHGA